MTNVSISLVFRFFKFMNMHYRLTFTETVKRKHMQPTYLKIIFAILLNLIVDEKLTNIMNTNMSTVSYDRHTFYEYGYQYLTNAIVWPAYIVHIVHQRSTYRNRRRFGFNHCYSQEKEEKEGLQLMLF